MKKIAVAMCMILMFAVLIAGCAKQYKAKEAALDQPINCAHAEGDIRALNAEKAHTKDRIKAGVQSIVPVSLVAGLVTKTEGTKIKVATGDYNKLLDKKIMQIQNECGVY
jgi:hypothetical protein